MKEFFYSVVWIVGAFLALPVQLIDNMWFPNHISKVIFTLILSCFWGFIVGKTFIDLYDLIGRLLK
jgi:hypothetical protein